MWGGGGGEVEGREIIASVQLALSDAATHTVPYFQTHAHKIATQNGLHMHSSTQTALEQQHCSGNSPVDNRATQLARLHKRGRNQRVWRPGKDD